MRSRILFVFLIFCFAFGFGGEVLGQTYTTTGVSTNWNDPAAWIRTGDCGAINNGGPPPPLTLNSGNACNVKIIVNHPITYTGSTQIGGGYMDSLIVNNGATLTFTSDLSIANKGSNVGPFGIVVKNASTLTINGTYLHQATATLDVTSGSSIHIGNNLTTGSYAGGPIKIDATSKLDVINTLTFNANNSLILYGELNAKDFASSSGGSMEFRGDSKVKISNNLTISNGSLSSHDNADIRVDGDFNMSGGGIYNGSDNSFLSVEGNNNVTSNRIVNLWNNAQVSIKGNTNGNVSLNVIDNACYKSSTRTGGTACVLCGETYTSDGTFYVPADVYEITIEAWGGGGAGGNGTSNISGGGGGGAYSKKTLSVTPGQPLAVYIGNGGNPYSATPEIRNGQISYVSANSSEPLPGRITNSVVLANGGQAPTANSGIGGTGGAVDSRATVSYKGSNGFSGGNNGWGGSSAATDGSNSTAGQDPLGLGGAGGRGGYGSGLGFNGSIYGGGGGGANVQWDSSLLYGGYGAQGTVVISFTCPTKEPCSRVLDYGTNGDYYIVEYYCDAEWSAPEGLAEFGVTAIGGGGGGGYGNAAGGGGGGAITSTPNSGIYFDINNDNGKQIGFPASTTFNVQVGDGGVGGTAASRGANGKNSRITGSFTDYSGALISYDIDALGGGGGGSSNNSANVNGVSGGFGGGGAVYSSDIDNTNTGTFGTGGLTNGAAGVRPNSDKKPISGGGGGGAASPGSLGTSSGNGQSKGGNGGDGLDLSSLTGIGPTLPGTFSGGGGGTATGASNANNNSPGTGGLGGGGNASTTGYGEHAPNNTGSGGGAGILGGGTGGSGKVFIYYPVYRILPVEFLYFNASYLKDDKSALLEWATAKEWENSHFEIERAVNTVKEWETIGRVEGSGYSDAPVEYNFTDIDLPITGGNIFYRLKQVDYSGKYSFSKTKAIQVEPSDSNTTWIAYPNPSAAGTEVQVELTQLDLYHDQPIHISLSNTLGQTKFHSLSSPEDISSIVSSWLNSSASGLYILDISWAAHRQQIKLMRK
ncbi:hypothetical protein LV85_03568 [Algoriphagus chordae]|uniref:Glycine-rich domain-containing protein n=2 Tax=Algoriphagus chordae TaxID=237019 RepID=A0A2W7QIR3_9BACT|nr:hypothetical protein LV85_03568 [Algoriphagus chordae]